MKKLLTLAVAGALVAPLAANAASDTVLYGSARISMQNCDGSYAQCGTTGNDVWSMKNQSSRVGIKGAEDLGGGLQAIYEFEFGVDPTTNGGYDPGTRPKWVGLKGSFGSLTLGRQWGPSYLFVGSVTDIFNDAGNLVSAQGGRISQAIIYDSPNFNAFKFAVAGIVDGADAGTPTDQKKDIDQYQIAALFHAGPVAISVADWAKPDTKIDDDIAGLGVKWNFGAGTLGFRYDSVKDSAASDSTNTGVSVEFPVGNEIFMAGYGKTKMDKSGYAEPSISRAEWQHNFSKRTRTWVAYIDYNPDNSAIDNSAELQIGIRHDF